MSQLRPADDFSLLTGGPFYRALIRANLTRPDLALAWWRATILAVLTWLPLFVLSLIEGKAYGDLDNVPFLFDFAAYARFLIAIPLLVTAERLAEARVVICVRHFVESGLVRKQDYPQFDAILSQIAAMRSSVAAEVVILLLVVVVGWMLRLDAQVSASSWRVVETAAGSARSLAGWWDLLVSTPIFQFLLLRWLWRYFIWCWMLWRLSRMDLRLYPTHPDQAGGLNFLGIAQRTFNRVVFAFSAILSATGGQALYAGTATIDDYRYFLIGYLVLILAVFVGPLYVFFDKLLAIRTKGIIEYGALAHEYVWLFHRKWIKREVGDTEGIVGSADIQSLADLGNSFATVRGMRVVPAVDLKINILPLLLSALAPFAPWALIVVPIDVVFAFLLGYV
jgi:hypothetical protein